MNRRYFGQGFFALGLSSFSFKSFGGNALNMSENQNAQPSRTQMLAWMDKLARPVLENLSKGTLITQMPVAIKPGATEKIAFGPLEAFSRTLIGIGPWLALDGLQGKELQLQTQYRSWLKAAFEQAFDSTQPDYLFHAKGPQVLVEAAFFSVVLVENWSFFNAFLSQTQKENIKTIFLQTRSIEPYTNNWILFSVMVEMLLMKMGETPRWEKIDTWLGQMERWYVGDGWYSDGASFHFDYYNSIVIHPFLRTIYACLAHEKESYQAALKTFMPRNKRLVRQLELLVQADGSFPAFGRSITYRCGVFHALADAIYKNELPEEVSLGKAKTAIFKLTEALFTAKANFTKDNWLTIGLGGHQPALGEVYINSGSVYLAASIFKPLGLAADTAFWQAKPEKLSSEQLWSGANLEADKALK